MDNSAVDIFANFHTFQEYNETFANDSRIVLDFIPIKLTSDSDMYDQCYCIIPCGT